MIFTYSALSFLISSIIDSKQKNFFCLFFLYLPRSYLVSDNFVLVDGLQVNFDFIATPTIEAKKATVQWKHFYKKVPWDTQQSAPPQLLTMELIPGLVYYYTPIAPFDLSEDESFSWLDWHVFTMVNGNDIHVLRTRDPTIDTSKTNTSLNREIGTRVDHGAFYTRPTDADDDSISRTNRRRSSPVDNSSPPVTKRYLREIIDNHSDRITRELNRLSNRINLNNNNQRRFNNYTQPQSASTSAPVPQAIPPTQAGNANLSQMTNDDIINWLRSRDR